jgi:hypothetical protein
MIATGRFQAIEALGFAVLVTAKDFRTKVATRAFDYDDLQ